MEPDNEVTTPAEIFSAVVATALPKEGEDFNVSMATYSGSGMARTHDD